MFEGLYCEHEATTYCSDDGSVSRTSFCTNGGSCIEVVGDDKAGFACDCPPAYIGDHCQFIAGSQPEDWDRTPALSVSNEGGGGGSSGGAIAGLAIGLLVVIIAAALLVKKRPEALRAVFGGKKGEDSRDDTAAAAVDEESKSPAKSTGSRDELELDADGGVLKEALSEDGSSAKSPNKIDSMENEEDLESNNDMPTSPSAEDAEIL